METKNSELDLMVGITADLLADIAAAVGFNVSRDVREVRRRCASEGASFLTKTLPALGKAFDNALSKSDTRMNYPGFKAREGYSEFLSDLFVLVFDRTGRSLSDACPSAVMYIRQILYLWYKYELPYTPEQEASILDAFCETDAQLPSSVIDCPVIQGARNVIARVVSGFSREAVSPRHGPGAVATKEEAWEKWRFKRLYRPIEQVFPFAEWYVPSVSYLSRSKDPLRHLSVHGHGTARAVFVPKDSRGPRLISCEPLEYQWIQQGVAAELIFCINSHEYTSGRVNFTHQDVNRRFARYGSMGAGWVTLDMAEASDRVSTLLVERLFANTHVLEYLLCCRTQCTVLPDGRRVQLNKFAPMGSALCFPVESLVFFALAVSVLVNHLGHGLSEALSRVKVYGDDLILHREDYAAVMQYFPYVGLKFNDKKCCTGGSFRESCGLDAFKGEDVTPVKIRTRLGDRRDSNSLVSWVEYSNALDFRGYYRVARTIERHLWELGHLDRGFIPTLEHSHPAVSFLAFRRHDGSLHRPALKHKNCFRWSDKLHRLEFLGVCVSGLSVKRELPSWDRLFAGIAKHEPRRATPYRNLPQWDSRSDQSKTSQDWMIGPMQSSVVTFPVRRRVTLMRRWCLFGGRP
jgi:hypothetical protein